MSIFSQEGQRTAQLDEYLHGMRAVFEGKYPEQPILLRTDSAPYAIGIYSQVIYPKLKIFAADKINVYKIAASHELVLIKVQPFHLPDATEIEERKLNAQLAFSAAMSNMQRMWEVCKGDPDDINPDDEEAIYRALHDRPKLEFHPKFVNNVHADKYLDTAKEEHLEWLAHKHPDEYPIHSTSSFLRLYYSFQQLNWAAL
jgi:hypothetical protein